MSNALIYPPPRLAAVPGNKERMGLLLSARDIAMRIADKPRHLAVRLWVRVRRIAPARLTARLTAQSAFRLVARLCGKVGHQRLGIAALVALSNPTVRARVRSGAQAFALRAVAGGRWLERQLSRIPAGAAACARARAIAGTVHRAWVHTTNRLIIGAQLLSGIVSVALDAVRGLARVLLVDQMARLLPWRAARIGAHLAVAAVTTRDTRLQEGIRVVPAPEAPSVGTGRVVTAPADAQRQTHDRPPAAAGEDEIDVPPLHVAENRAARRVRQQEEARARRRAPLPQ